MIDYLKLIKEAVVFRKISEIEGLVKDAVNSGFDPIKIINNALVEAMDEVGRDFAASKIFIPEMLVSALTMKKGLNILKPLLEKGGDQSTYRRKMVIATVKGDLHDIGKNLVAMMVEAAGFEVVDLGTNVDKEIILEAVKKHSPDILGLSALLSTTIMEMGRVINTLVQSGLRHKVKVIVGGAPVTEYFAKQIGADGYGRDAAMAVELCRNLLK